MLVVKQKQTYDPLLFEFALGVGETFRKQGYSLLIHLTPEGNVRFEEVNGRADGLILTDIEEDDERVRELAGRIPLVLFGESALAVPQVDIDDVGGAVLATEHLLALGYRDIAMVAGDGRSLFMKNRVRGYMDSMRKAGANPTIAYGSLDIAGGEIAMHSFGRLPEAVFCASDGMAVGVLKFLALHNLAIPVVGCDGLQIGEITTPTLTSIKLPFYRAGQELAGAILAEMNGQGATKVLISPELVVRESTWPKQVEDGDGA